MKTQNKHNILPISLCVLGGGLLLGNYASALTESDDLTARTTIKPYVAIEVGVDKGEEFNDNILDLGTIVPTAGGTFASDKLVTRVYTNSGDGYQLKLQDEDADNAMKHANTAVTTQISALSSATTGVNNLGAGFPTNSWGYALGEFADGNTLDFAGVPTTNETAATLKQTTEWLENGYEDTTVTFGLKADLNLAAGVYADKVVFTASVNLEDPEPDTDREAFYTITKMQEMTPAVCASVATPSASETNVPQTTLTDERDGKSYTVRKLADGNCWMSGYMAYDLKPGDTFTPDDTDVQSDWTAAGAGVTIVGNVTSGAWPNDNGLRYYGQSQSLGNLYNWNAATLGSAIGMDSGEAPASICPKGWKLMDSNDLPNLVGIEYGFMDGETSMGFPTNAEVAGMTSAPISLTPTNWYNNGTLDDGENTDITVLWTRTLESDDGPYHVLFQPHDTVEEAHMIWFDAMATSGTTYQYGMAVRCIAK